MDMAKATEEEQKTWVGWFLAGLVLARVCRDRA